MNELTQVRRICFFCGKHFFSHRPDAKYCSGTCRGKAYRWRKRLPETQGKILGLLNETLTYLDYADSRPLAVAMLSDLFHHLSRTMHEHGIRRVK